MSLKGACRCGALSYELALRGLPAVYACHCLDCQTWSSSAFGLHALVPAGSLKLEGSSIAYAPVEGTEHHLCPRCHTRIYNTNERVPGLAILRAGTLTDSARLRPVAHIWTCRKQAWLQIPEHVPQFEEDPTPEQFARAAAPQIQPEADH